MNVMKKYVHSAGLSCY